MRMSSSAGFSGGIRGGRPNRFPVRRNHRAGIRRAAALGPGEAGLDHWRRGPGHNGRRLAASVRGLSRSPLGLTFMNATGRVPTTIQFRPH